MNHADHILNLSQQVLEKVRQVEVEALGTGLVSTALLAETMDLVVETLAAISALHIQMWEYEGRPDPYLQPQIITELLSDIQSLHGSLLTIAKEKQIRRGHRLLEQASRFLVVCQNQFSSPSSP